MGDFMRSISFEHLISWCLEEYKTKASVFGIRKDKFYVNKSRNYMTDVLGDQLASPVGPAAGPHSQLAQNIITSYLTGARFIELKTVQKMDGEEIRQAIKKPCINAEDECYNCEWSTELTVEEAFAEYIKAYFAIKVLAKEFKISEGNDFAYNMSVGYDLEGIKTKKIDNYIEGLKDASKTEIFKECYEYLSKNLDLFENFAQEDLNKISPKVCNSITLSTLHGCPADEIEKIATYLLKEKKLNTFVKCNPTMLGYEFARKTLDYMGYDYIVFDDHHFKEDLQFDEACTMIKRLLLLSKDLGLKFGVKLTNTFPVDVERNEVPADEMYMSGRALLPLSISLAQKLSKEFDGKLPISYSGGADAFNIEEIFKIGIQPITMATSILKPGGYNRFKQVAELVEPHLNSQYQGIDVEKLTILAEKIIQDERNHKSYREKVRSRKTESELPLFDCYKAPCKDGGCPIHQQIPEYLKLVSQEKYDQAIKVITTDNTAPTILGTLCSQPCREHCTRLDYDKSLSMKAMKKIAADHAQENLMRNLKKSDLKSNKKVAVIGAGPAGIAVATFLRRNGIKTVVFEKLDQPYGIVKHIIPSFRISEEEIKRDYQLALAQGVEFRFGQPANYDIKELKKEYDYVVIATGAWKKAPSPVKEGKGQIVDALEFLWNAKKKNKVNLGCKVAVIGAGDVAMDCARVAKRAQGVEEVAIVYRRTETYMPASQEEINSVKKENIKIYELLAPVRYDGKILVCEKMKLGDYDASGRRSVKGTGQMVELAFDSVIGATGAKVDTSNFEKNEILLDEKGRPQLTNAFESNQENVYIIGDCRKGPSTIVQAMADAKVVAKDIMKKESIKDDFIRYSIEESEQTIYSKRGILEEVKKDQREGNRCLKCDQICEICVEVCPNRANIMIEVEGFEKSHQIVHIDGMCNECGNCGVFCPHIGNPYKDKVTIFWTKEDFDLSDNIGFLRLDNNKYLVRTETGNIVEHIVGDSKISQKLEQILITLIKKYEYCLENAIVKS
ncbi:putative selenate reductase subunit YgfK [Garciella nitratireducens]|uniref:Putative selenate reductase n=1 Tax=Garciella nitratireducens DSM 15102 TaxID=1121911 RepID=A0A1T4NC63_9FIRM|nr:putative selenate reductase subunit YgfK [Garciella nitratireducens]SJZ76627.1 putative selenate reductase [Garciella nitratireducens DSM 15102]